MIETEMKNNLFIMKVRRRKKWQLQKKSITQWMTRRCRKWLSIHRRSGRGSFRTGRRSPILYIHGSIPDNEIKFILCIPEKDKYEGRFFQYLSPFPGPDEEVASLKKSGEDDAVAFALTHGAYFVESNMGSKFAFGGAADPTLCWKASAAVAEHSRKIVMDLYGVTRPYGYVYGGSGGGYKSMACIENTDAWDGACPYVIGSPVSLPNTITMHVQGQRRLRYVFGKIVDALDAGGSGNPYEGLTENEAAMLKGADPDGIPAEGMVCGSLRRKRSGFPSCADSGRETA